MLVAPPVVIVTNPCQDEHQGPFKDETSPWHVATTCLLCNEPFIGYHITCNDDGTYADKYQAIALGVRYGYQAALTKGGWLTPEGGFTEKFNGLPTNPLADASGKPGP